MGDIMESAAEGNPSPTGFALSPHGIVLCLQSGAPWSGAFAKSEEAGLVALGGQSAPSDADATALFWKSVADDFIRGLCHLPEGSEDLSSLAAPEIARLSDWVLSAPPMRGAEYLSPEVLLAVWDRLLTWTRGRIDEGKSGLAEFLGSHAPAWSRVGRVTLHLAENKQDPQNPFAFMASYASGLSTSGRLVQIPLGKALQEYSGAKNKAALLKLLTPLHNAGKACPLMAGLIDSGDVFHPIVWTPQEALAFLRNVPLYEDAGLLIRLPNWWQKRAARPRVAATIGQKKGTAVGLDALLDFQLHVEVDGEKLTRKEVATLLAGEDGLVHFRGQWIEVDREKLREALDHWESLEGANGLSFIEGMRLLAGAPGHLQEDGAFDAHREWAFAQPGEWMTETLRKLSNPDPAPPPASLCATLRPYQTKGLDWLWFCARTGLGACLADDMGLGKTIQVLAVLLRKKEALPEAPPSLLVVPASLIGNWKREAAQFAPSLRLHIAHRSEPGEGDPTRLDPKQLAGADLVITTYGTLTRLDWPAKTQWGWVILDEAQAIKNHASRQSKAVRSLPAGTRIALTGTPVENNLGDLWSLFDFINPGLLGTAAQFKGFVNKLRTDNQEHYGPLRRLVAPYILRRLKTDKSIIADLPEKTEMKIYCGLSPAQASLYQQTAAGLAKALEAATGIQRRGLVLAYLMRFKQICNHPDQLTKDGAYDNAHSAKFLRLSELCGEIASRGEKALVFTQFREITDPLECCLARVFSRRGLVLHGGTPVKERQHIVARFQLEAGPPFFILSLKAGGTGLNLTAATHVIHFDRWWNPAVENQATDRAFRIGQKRNVLVHKFITSGTLEEKIDTLITEKQATADAVLAGGTEKILTEMNDSELLDFVRLDLDKAQTAQ